MNKRFLIGVYCLFSLSFLFADTSKVRKIQPGNQTKSSASKTVNKNQPNECNDYNQVIINDTDFPVKITLLNEETHFFEEYDLLPNEIHIIPERLFVNPSRSKKIHIVTNYIYISSIKYISPNECVYLLKATKRNPTTDDEAATVWNSLDEDGDVYVISEEVVPVEEVLQTEDNTTEKIVVIPEEPVVPLVPETPVEPVLPVEPAIPAETESPEEPAVSVYPETIPAEPELPVETSEPAMSSEPEFPAEPAMPAEPVTSAEPELAAEPELPVETETPEEQTHPVTETVESETPVMPEEPAASSSVIPDAEFSSISEFDFPVFDEPMNNFTDSPDEEMEKLY